MQNALIKRKLEEQKENYRRRQEGQLLPGGETQNSKVRGTDSPLAFTPTAVMKKIAADRRDSDPAGGKIPVPELKISSSAEKENGEMFNILPPGGGMLPLPSLSAQQQQQAQAMLLQQQQQQQQQQQRMRLQAMQHQMAALQQATSPTSLLEQQQRLIMFQQHQMQQQQQQQHFGHQHQQQQFGHHPQHQGYQGRNVQQPQQQVGLSRFFTPEVLAQAQSGNGPAMPPLPTQKALTLEEIERQAAAVRI